MPDGSNGTCIPMLSNPLSLAVHKVCVWGGGGGGKPRNEAISQCLMEIMELCFSLQVVCQGNEERVLSLCGAKGQDTRVHAEQNVHA